MTRPRTLRFVEILAITLGKLEKTILGFAVPEALYEVRRHDWVNKCIFDTPSNLTFMVRLFLTTLAVEILRTFEHERLVKKLSIFLLITFIFWFLFSRIFLRNRTWCSISAASVHLAKTLCKNDGTTQPVNNSYKIRKRQCLSYLYNMVQC